VKVNKATELHIDMTPCDHYRSQGVNRCEGEDTCCHRSTPVLWHLQEMGEIKKRYSVLMGSCTPGSPWLFYLMEGTNTNDIVDLKNYCESSLSVLMEETNINEILYTESYGVNLHCRS
jgi:hypothetical protein